MVNGIDTTENNTKTTTTTMIKMKTKSVGDKKKFDEINVGRGQI